MRRALPHLGLAALAGTLYLLGGLEFVENRLADARYGLVRRAASNDLTVVEIDPRSLRTLDVWPWPRGYHATVLENLIGAGARRVAFDIDFSSRSDPEEDAALEQALAASQGRVILAVFRQWQRDGSGGLELASSEPLAAFLPHVSLATINIRPDNDGVVRRYRLDDVLPGSRLQPMAAALGGEPKNGLEEFRMDFGIDLAGIPMISFLDVLTGQFEPGLVRGRAVLIGATAVELGDQVAVPRGTILPGPILQALAYESLVQGRTLERVPPAFVIGVAFVIALLLGGVVERLSWRGGLALAAFCFATFFAASLALQRTWPLLLSVSPWCLTLGGSYVFGLIRRVDQQAVRLLLESARLRRTEVMMRRVVETSFDAILTVDEYDRVRTLNPSAEEMFGYRARDMLGQPVESLLEGGLPGGPDRPQDTQGGRPGPVPAVGRRKTGATFPVEVTVARLRHDDRALRVAFLRDVTQRRAHEEALRHQATHDALTGLPNRSLLQERVDRALAGSAGEGTTAAVLLLDLDRFKEINDTLGHHVGDHVLQQIARRLEQPLRQSDTIARLGGDEFALLLPGTGPDEAALVARRLLEALGRPFLVGGLSLHVDASIGVAMFPNHGSDVTTLVQRADVAMYAAKKSRSLVCFYDPAEDFNSVRQLTLKGELRRALDEGQLALYYQPKVSGGGRGVEGVEALVRWAHPEHGILSPGEFVGLAENTGLIRPLTRWVLLEAFRQAAKWDREGLPVTVAVNLSARNLMEEDLPQAIEALLNENRLPPSRATIEITESVIVEDPRRAYSVISKIASLGVRVSIDDFGTGYSSLDYLKRFPATELKIDRTFVMGMDRSEGDSVIVRSTIELAHNLGMRVVAEGVESDAAWETLQALGCDAGQGFHFCRPAPASEIGEWLRTSKWARSDRPHAAADGDATAALAGAAGGAGCE